MIKKTLYFGNPAYLSLSNSQLVISVALITCNDKRMPTGMLLPLQGNTTQNERFRKQIEASLPPLSLSPRKYLNFS